MQRTKTNNQHLDHKKLNKVQGCGMQEKHDEDTTAVSHILVINYMKNKC